MGEADTIQFEATGPQLDKVKTESREIYFHPPIPLIQGDTYRVQVKNGNIKVWHLIVDDDCQVQLEQ